MVRHIAADMDEGVVSQIDARLDRVRSDEGVAIPLAIESGSRAWGFPSPDSDYDCRFFFVRPLDDYLALFPKRDVIETPLDRVFDVNGWDLAKALKLLLKGNAVGVEWLNSPIVYHADADFRADFLALVERVADRSLTIRHYLYLGEWHLRNRLSDPAEVSLKKLFYVLRPAAMLRWLREHPQAAFGPMDISTLLAQAAPPADAGTEIVELLARKAITRELGLAPLPDGIARFIAFEFDWARKALRETRVAPREEARSNADDFFRRMVRRFDPPR